MQSGPEEHRLFVGRLSADVGDEELERAFSEYGPTFNISILRGHGFVSFYRKQHAENAMQGMDGKFLGYRAIRVKWAWGWPIEDSSDEDSDAYEVDADEYDTVFNQTVDTNCTMYIGGHSPFCRTHLEELFSRYGEIEDITVFDDRDYAFIRYESKVAATLAICSGNKLIINGDPVRCSWAHRPHQTDQVEIALSSTSSESSPESSQSSSLGIDEFDIIYNQTSESNCTVYCGGLMGYITRELIEETFNPFGGIEEISLYTERSDYAFIRFNTKVAATLAICSVNGTAINDHTVRCSWAHRPEKPNSEGQQATASSSISDESSSVSIPPGAAASSSISEESSSVSNPPGAAATASLPEKDPKRIEKGKTRNPDVLCKICMDEELGIVFLPCGHLTSCSRCAQKIVVCPMCRKKITGKVRTYLS